MTWTPKTEYRIAGPESISRADIEALGDWLGCGTEPGGDRPAVPWLTQGDKVRELEAAFAAKVGSKHAVFVNSGSSANLLAWFLPIAIDRASVAENLRVVVPAVSWATSVMPAIQFGYTPVLCDPDEETWGLDPVHLRRLCESEKGAPSIVLLVHVLGVPCKMKEIAALKEEFGFLLIEDACGAFGSSPIGTIGDITTYSTYFAHQLTTIEGGFVCSNAAEGDNLLRMLRAHGWTADCDAGTKARMREAANVDAFREKFTFYLPGFNVRNTDLAAHLGLSQMKRADASSLARRANHGLYVSKFAGAKDFAIQKRGSEGVEVASIGFGVLAASKSHRNKVAEALAAKGIETRPIAGGNMARQPFWTAAYGPSKRERPLADRIHDCGFQLPNGPHLAVEDVAYIAETVLAVKP